MAWAEFVTTSMALVTTTRNMDIEGMEDRYAERALGEHYTALFC